MSFDDISNLIKAYSLKNIILTKELLKKIENGLPESNYTIFNLIQGLSFSHQEIKDSNSNLIESLLIKFLDNLNNSNFIKKYYSTYSFIVNFDKSLGYEKFNKLKERLKKIDEILICSNIELSKEEKKELLQNLQLLGYMINDKLIIKLKEI